MWASDISKLIKETRRDLTNMAKMARESDSEAVEMIALDIEERMGAIVTNMRDDGIFVATQVGHNGSSSQVYNGQII
jgi:hypothetical protein